MRTRIAEDSLVDTTDLAENVKEEMGNNPNKTPEEIIAEKDTQQQVTESDKEEIMQNIVKTPEELEMQKQQEEASTITGSARTLLNNLNIRYAKEDLELIKALKVWKLARLSPEKIRAQIQDDIGQAVTAAEAKVLYRVGTDLVSGHASLNFNTAHFDEMEEHMAALRVIKLTSKVRASVDRIGKNLFRTKQAGIMWKLDMKNMDDGQQVPYLVRVETSDEDEATGRV